MLKAYARQTKITNVVGRSDYISNQGRQEEIVLHSRKNMKSTWQEYADYENANKKNKEQNIQAREIVIALPNELNNNHQKLENIVEEYSRKITGDNRDYEYAVHWNKNRTNLHAHIIFSERERQEQSPKKYKRDVYYNEEEKIISSKKDSKAKIIYKKGDVQFDKKKGQVKFEDKFSKKDTRFKSNDFNEQIKSDLVEVLNKHNFKFRLFDNEIELPQLKLFRGANDDYIEKAKATNKARQGYNKMAYENATEYPESRDTIKGVTMTLKNSIIKENSILKKISMVGINQIKLLAERVNSLIKEKYQILKKPQHEEKKTPEWQLKINELNKKKAILRSERISLNTEANEIERDIKSVKQIICNQKQEIILLNQKKKELEYDFSIGKEINDLEKQNSGFTWYNEVKERELKELLVKVSNVQEEEGTIDQTVLGLSQHKDNYILILKERERKKAEEHAEIEQKKTEYKMKF